MSDLANKLSFIKEKKQKLIEEEFKLIEKRKLEIGQLAERFHLLTVSDNLMAGIFSEVENALTHNPQKLNEWESLGNNYLATKKINSRTAQESSK